MVRSQKHGVVQLENPTNFNTDEVQTCEECKKQFTGKRAEHALTMHQIRKHGWKLVDGKRVKVQVGESGAPKKRKEHIRLSLEQRYEIIEYMKANKGRINLERLSKAEVLEEICGLLSENGLTEAHIMEPAKIAGVKWIRGNIQCVIVRADTELLNTFVLLFGELWARLGDLLGDEPKILIQAKAQLKEQLRKERDNGNGTA